MIPDDDSRHIPRIEIECPMTYHDIDSSDVKNGIARNVSNSGILFTTMEKLADGAIKEVHIRPPGNKTPPLDAIIQIVRVNEDDQVPGQYRIAGMIKAIK